MAVKPVNYSFWNHERYQKKPSVEYQRFNEEYFSGADVRIYFGDIWVDEITNLNFTLMENVAPIFGYASHTYDAVARGSRQIQGSFQINFKENSYLHSISNSLESKLERDLESFDTGTVQGNKLSSSYQHQEGATIEQLLSKAQAGQDTDFEKLAVEMERSLWGESTVSEIQEEIDSKEHEGFFYPESSRPNLARNGFNILIFYGPYQQAQVGQSQEVAATSAHSIIGVHLTGVNQIIDGSGQPVLEEYSFIAKDLDGNINLFGSRPYNPNL